MSDHEGDGEHTTLPHSFEGAEDAYPRWYHDSPFADEALFALAGTAVRAEKLGWGIVVALAENAQLSTARSTHGGPWAHDREVPLILMGSGIGRGRAFEPARTVDVAPTLAARGAGHAGYRGWACAAAGSTEVNEGGSGERRARW